MKEGMESKVNKTAEEKPEKTAKEKIEDFTKMGTEEKEEFISDVLENSADLMNAYKEIEIDAAGGQYNLKERVGVLGRVKIKFAESFGGKEKGEETAFREIAKVAHREVDKELVLIGDTSGKQLLEKKAALSSFEKNSSSDLKNLEDLGVHSPESLQGIKDKLNSEKDELKEEINSREEELMSKLSNYSETALEKQKELDGCLEEYQGYYNNVTSEKKAAEKNIIKYEKGLANLKLEGETAEKYKEDIRRAIEEQKEKIAKLDACEKVLKQRLEIVKANKNEVDTYLETIKNIGKTPEEIKQRKAEEMKKAKEKAGRAQMEEIKQTAGGVSVEEVDRGGGGTESPSESDERAVETTGTTPEKQSTGKKTKEQSTAKSKVETDKTVSSTSKLDAFKQNQVEQKSKEKSTERSDKWIELLSRLLNLSLTNHQKEKIKDYFIIGDNKQFAAAALMDENQAISRITKFLHKEMNYQKSSDQIRVDLINKIKSIKEINK